MSGLFKPKFFFVVTFVMKWLYKETLIDWCLTPTLATFQLYCGTKTFYYTRNKMDEYMIKQVQRSPVVSSNDFSVK
jgi:hypothetical protein